MTTADRIDPIYRAWAPTVVVAGEGTYLGKHRRPGARTFSLRRMFYIARHLNRGR
ncbi:MAG: hypothetical protein M3Y44_01080 [Actinomycetota bacterium]|nr:hypothetical protein [Actinomycetota bacterium]